MPAAATRKTVIVVSLRCYTLVLRNACQHSARLFVLGWTHLHCLTALPTPPGCYAFIAQPPFDLDWFCPSGAWHLDSHPTATATFYLLLTIIYRIFITGHKRRFRYAATYFCACWFVYSVGSVLFSRYSSSALYRLWFR